MRRSLLVCLLLLASVAAAQGKKTPREADLGKKSATTIDKSLAGDISRKKEKEADAPALQYDQFRLGVEVQVASKRREQIESLQEDHRPVRRTRPRPPSLLFRLGELYWEESKFFEFEANRKDDELIKAMNRNDAAGQHARQGGEGGADRQGQGVRQARRWSSTRRSSRSTRSSSAPTRCSSSWASS